MERPPKEGKFPLVSLAWIGYKPIINYLISVLERPEKHILHIGGSLMLLYPRCRVL